MGGTCGTYGTEQKCVQSLGSDTLAGLGRRQDNISMVQKPLVGHGPHCSGFTITLRHTTLGRTALNVRSARRRDLYLTTYTTL